MERAPEFTEVLGLARLESAALGRSPRTRCDRADPRLARGGADESAVGAADSGADARPGKGCPKGMGSAVAIAPSMKVLARLAARLVAKCRTDRIHAF